MTGMYASIRMILLTKIVKPNLRGFFKKILYFSVTIEPPYTSLPLQSPHSCLCARVLFLFCSIPPPSYNNKEIYCFTSLKISWQSLILKYGLTIYLLPLLVLCLPLPSVVPQLNLRLVSCFRNIVSRAIWSLTSAHQTVQTRGGRFSCLILWTTTVLSYNSMTPPQQLLWPEYGDCSLSKLFKSGPIPGD